MAQQAVSGVNKLCTRMKRRTDVFDFIYQTIGIVWLFMMLFTTRLFTVVKTAMLVFLVFVAVVEIIYKTIPIVRKHIRYVVAFAIFSFLSLVIGGISGFDFNMSSEFPLIQYYIITPFCVLFLATVIGRSERRKEFLWKALIAMTALLAVLDVMKVGTAMIGMSLPFLGFIDLASATMTEELAVRASNETSLLFLLPIILFLLLNEEKSAKKLVLYLISIGFGFVYAFISGRKILYIEIALTIVYSLWYLKTHKKIKNTPPNLRRGIKPLIIWGAILLVFGIVAYSDKIFGYISAAVGIDDIGRFAYDTVINGLSSGAGGVTKRMGNIDALMEMFYDSPIWGNGLNSYAANSLACDTSKWSYEVSFIAWLAQTGIIGMMFLAVLAIYITKRLHRFGKRGDVRYDALMVGFLCFMLASASNPMIYLVWPWTIVDAYCIQTRYA